MHARDIMTRHVLTVPPAATAARAAALLATKGYSALPVVGPDGALVGMVTEGDLVRDRFPGSARDPGEDDEREATLVGDVMTTATAATNSATDVVALAHTMISANRRSIPIVDSGRLVGVVTRHDIVRALARSDADIAADVRKRLELFGGAGRWTVEVHDGVVHITDRYDDAGDRPIAEALAGSVLGVIQALVHSGSADSSRPVAGNPM